MQKGPIFSAVFLLTAFLGLVVLVASNQHSSAAAPEGSSEYLQFLPYTIKPSNTDMAITSVEIVQTVQRSDNSVPLVAQKAGYARIYAQMITGNATNNIAVSLTATRNGSVLGAETQTITVPTSTSRGSFNSSVNIELPTSWLDGNVQLVAKVDANNAIFEISESNNTVTVNANFIDVPDLNVVIVPIRYTHTPNGNTYQEPGNPDPFSNWLRRTYPVGNVNITHRPLYNFTGNLSGSAAWSQILNEMAILKDFSGESSDTVFYGLVPVGSGSNQWFFSGIAGIGYIGYRASVGLNLGTNDSTGALTGHEIGHNFGRRHAPCGGPAGVDGNYPYGNASVGEYGLDIFNGSVELVTPSSHRDVMGYCSPEWMSDYTYTALLNDQLISLRTISLGAANQLYIQADLSADGEVSIQPVYALEMALQQADNPSDYHVELLAEDGRLLSTQPMNLRYAEEPGIEVRSLQTAVLYPNQAVASVRIVKDGEVLAARNLNDVAAARQVPAALSETSDAITLTWGNSAPTVVRYTTNDGETWQVLGANITDGQLTIEKDGLASENGRFEIITADAQQPQTQTISVSTD